MKTIQLTSGERVRATAFHCRLTYDGLLVGRPAPAINNLLIERMKGRLEELYGKETPKHAVDPVMSKMPEGGERLPEWANSVLLENSEPHEHLAVAWFSEDQDDQAISSRIEAAVRDLPWKELAGRSEP